MPVEHMASYTSRMVLRIGMATVRLIPTFIGLDNTSITRNTTIITTMLTMGRVRCTTGRARRGSACPA